MNKIKWNTLITKSSKNANGSSPKKPKKNKPKINNISLYSNEYEFFDLTADMIRIYIGLCTVYPDNKLDTDPFPMSTIENISVEFN